jgi:phospholipid-translocating ATPase
VPRADCAYSWTIITWAVLIGSDLLMVIWIIVYSFIPNTDFVNETVVLFGELTFWVTVVLTSAIALCTSLLLPCTFPNA